jgi:hypothetical protein
MRDVTFNEIVDEVHRDFPSLIPKFVIKAIVNFAFKKIFTEIRRKNREFSLPYCEISKVYEIVDGKAVFGLAADLDETKVKKGDDFAPFKRMDYYVMHVHNSGIGKKKSATIHRCHRKHKVV